MPLLDHIVPVKMSVRTCVDLQVENYSAILLLYDCRHTANSRVGRGAVMCVPAFTVIICRSLSHVEQYFVNIKQELSYRKPLLILRQRSKSSSLVDNVIAESCRPFSWCCFRHPAEARADVNERKTSLEIVPISKISNSRGADQKYKLNSPGRITIRPDKPTYSTQHLTKQNNCTGNNQRTDYRLNLLAQLRTTQENSRGRLVRATARLQAVVNKFRYWLPGSGRINRGAVKPRPDMRGSDNSGLSESIRYVGDTYNDIGKLFDEQPKHDWGPLGDILHIYKGILAAFPDILTVHKDTMAKRKDCERLTLDHKMETSQLQQVIQRTDVVSYALLAEINHFHAERTTQIRKAMKSFLCEQVAFYQKIAAKLQDAYSLFEDQ
ncbi:Sorting nexin-9 [Homalodisca vitripennis]|nr:Sorting nexin-9 [Homalodisca vitripennis]